MGLAVSVLTTHVSDPAAQVVGQTQIGSLNNEGDLRRFLSELDFVTFESEFVDTALVARCLPKTCQAFPSLNVLASIQDRLTQKQLLERFIIPTSPWMPVDSAADLHQAMKTFPDGFVLKQRRFGYDGYGTFVVRTPRDLDESILSKSKFGFIAEAFVKFKRELAISFVRANARDFVSLPLVESVQEDSRCFSVSGPRKHKGVTKITTAFRRLMQELDYKGILAVELFETPKGLLVNELAPRVHNSAHYSQQGLSCDQFEYHLRAGLGLHLPRVELIRPGFAMVNLLGEGAPQTQLSLSPFGKLHWYGKQENRAGRKLGHINVLDSNSKRALTRALKWRKEFKL